MADEIKSLDELKTAVSGRAAAAEAIATSVATAAPRLPERDNLGRRTELTWEVENVAHRRCAKRIDCLCIVTDDRQPTAGRLQCQ